MLRSIKNSLRYLKLSMDATQISYSFAAEQQLYFYQCTEFRLEVLQNQHHIWLEINGVVQSACQIHAPYRPVLAHTLTMMLPQIHHKVPSSILELGGGGQSMQRYLALTQPQINFTSIEYSQEVINAVVQYMPESSGLNIIAADAFAYIDSAHANKQSFDWLVVDLFLGSNEPEQVFDDYFFKRCYQLINEDGWLIFNCLRSDDEVLRTIAHNIEQAFNGPVKLFAVPGMLNHIYLAHKAAAGNAGSKSTTYLFPKEIEQHNIVEQVKNK